MDAARIVADASSIEEHMARARDQKMPTRDPASTATPDLRAATAFVASFADDPPALFAWRQSQQRLLSRVDAILQPLHELLRCHTPAHIASNPVSLKPLLVEALATACGMQSADVGFNLFAGFITVGDIPDSGLFRPAPRAADVDPSTFDHAAWASELHDSVARRGKRLHAKGRDAAKQVYDKTVEEAAEGWCVGPLSREQVQARFPTGYWPTRRFGVEQKGAVRPCDNGRESKQNSASSQRETITNTTAELPASIASLLFAILGDRCHLRGGSDDWRKAYRQCGARDPACQVVAVWNPYSRCVSYFLLHGMEFGQLPAVNNFNLVAKVMTRVARLLFAFCGGNYFDDYVVVEPTFAGSTAQECLLFLHNSCGFLLDKKKHEPMEPAFKFVGVMHDLSHAHLGRVSLMILKDRAERISTVCKRVRATRKIFAGQAASLRGKLYFSCTTAFGKVGRDGQSVPTVF